MAESLLTITGVQVTIDESAGLQTGGAATTTEDNNDSDVTALSAAIATQLATAATADQRTIPGTAVGFAVSNGNVVTVNSTSLNDIAFTDSTGAPLNGVNSGLTTLAENPILLFSSGSNNNIVYGIDQITNHVVFALVLEETTTGGVTTGAKIWTALYEPIAHTVDGAPSIANHDDVLDLTNKLFVSASESLAFDFAGTPSGNHLFTMVQDGSSGLVATPESEVVQLHVSQGGGPTTLGLFNQMIDPNETMVFTFVTNPNAGTTVPNLSQGEADSESNILFTDVLTITSGSVSISQTQGNDPAGMRLTALNTKGDGVATEPSGDGFINGYANDPIAAISEVRVFDDNGTLLLTATGDVTTPVNGITVDFLASGAVEVRGLEDDYKVEYDATSHERLKVTGLEGKFDIGGIDVNEVGTDTDEVGSNVNFEDDGPSIGGSDNKIDNSIVDFAAGSTATKSLEGAAGADGNAGYTITTFPLSIVVNDVTVKGELSADKHTVTYFEDKDSSGTFNAGDTKYYTLDLSQPGAGSYTFNVFVSAPPAELDFDFAGTPSGNHLFTMVQDGSSGLVATPESEVVQLHVSQGGGPTTLGLFNQMIDPNETMVFTFVTNPNAGTTVPNLSQGEADSESNILFTNVFTITDGSVSISQTQGNDPAGMRLTALNTKGDGVATEPSGDGFINGYANDPIAAISEVRVFDDNGTLLLTATGDVTTPVNGITVDFLASGAVDVRGLEDDYKVEYDATSHERLKVTGLEGKFDIGGIGTTLSNPTPDQTLDFTAKITDGDGDFSTAPFSVGIDGTGVFDDGHVDGVLIV